jgi:hypothetical protein
LSVWFLRRFCRQLSYNVKLLSLAYSLPLTLVVWCWRRFSTLFSLILFILNPLHPIFAEIDPKSKNVYIKFTDRWMDRQKAVRKAQMSFQLWLANYKNRCVFLTEM